MAQHMISGAFYILDAMYALYFSFRAYSSWGSPMPLYHTLTGLATHPCRNYDHTQMAEKDHLLILSCHFMLQTGRQAITWG